MTRPNATLAAVKPPAPADAVVELRNVVKAYRKADQVVTAVDEISLHVQERGLTAIVGPSGSGKSTLLHMIGAMDRPSSGTVVVAGKTLNTLSEAELTRFRRESVGFVFQSFNLIPNLSALENVTLPMEFAGISKAERIARARSLLERFGLAPRLNHRPKELSGGEMQRVAIARAMANEPRLILADEPTGNLDSKTGQTIYGLLKEVARERTVLVVTHDERLAQLADRVLHIRDGRIEDDTAASRRM